MLHFIGKNYIVFQGETPETREDQIESLQT